MSGLWGARDAERHGAARAGRDRRPRTLIIGMAVLVLGGALAWTGTARGADLASVQVRSEAAADALAFDGIVQAVRQTTVAAQVSGAVVVLNVKAGDRVKAGQVLLQLDARAAEQTAAAGDAQVQAARAARQAASKEFERQTQLFQKNYISRAALDRAEAQFKATQAEVAAQLAGAGAARTASGHYVVKAPYGGVVADAAVMLGDMAMPGRALLTLYDPAALRISVNVPQTAVPGLTGELPARIELPGSPAESRWLEPAKVQALPTMDPATHTLELRLDLPVGLKGVAPGMFARAWLAVPGGSHARLYVPTGAIVQRAELSGLYVIGADDRPALRQVRLGRSAGREVEVLSGVSAGERVALDPQAATRVR